MSEQRTEEKVVPLLCRVLGHRWRLCHVLTKDWQGQDIWAYHDHTCTRCYTTQKRSLWPSL